MYSGQGSVGIVQAILINVYTKEPSDGSAFVKIGVAVRMGYQLGWNQPRTQAIAIDDPDRRLILVRTCLLSDGE